MAETYDILAARRARIQREMSELREQLDRLEVVPNLEDYPDGTVIKCVTRWASGPALTYVFLKIVVRADPGGGSSTQPPVTRWYYTGHLGRYHNSDRTRDRSGEGCYLRSDQLASWMTEHARVIESWELMLPATDGGDDGTIEVYVMTNGGTLDRVHNATWNSLTKRWEM